jgi:hypothetical protein
MLFFVPVLAACAATKSAPTPEGGLRNAFAVDDYTLPRNSIEAAADGSDLSGDGAPNNALGDALVGLVSEDDMRDDASIRRLIGSGLDSTVIEVFDDDGDEPGAIVGVRYGGASVLRAQVLATDAIATTKLQPNDATIFLPAIIDAEPTPLDVVYMQLEMASDGSGYEVRVQGMLDDDEVKHAACAGFIQLLATDPANSMRRLLDSNGDGTVTPDECVNSSVIQTLLAPDLVGSDGVQYLSFGIALHAQPERNQEVFE